jgi:hypothetical protein
MVVEKIRVKITGNQDGFVEAIGMVLNLYRVVKEGKLTTSFKGFFPKKYDRRKICEIDFIFIENEDFKNMIEKDFNMPLIEFREKYTLWSFDKSNYKIIKRIRLVKQ